MLGAHTSMGIYKVVNVSLIILLASVSPPMCHITLAFHLFVTGIVQYLKYVSKCTCISNAGLCLKNDLDSINLLYYKRPLVSSPLLCNHMN